jgi:hypothetical protein
MNVSLEKGSFIGRQCLIQLSLYRYQNGNEVLYHCMYEIMYLGMKNCT